MSRVSSKPVVIPKGVELKTSGQRIEAKGPKGQLVHQVHDLVDVQLKDQDGEKVLAFAPKEESKQARALAGTTRSVLFNIVQGVHDGFEKQLELVGVGYRAQVQGSDINLNLGFSHPVKYNLPKGVSAQAPSNTNLVLQSADKQLLGQVAAEIRRIRPPEPYKGKGVRYAGEHIVRKETKKK